MPITLIEFYDKSPLENIVSSLVMCPQKVIFLGSNRKNMEHQIENFINLFEMKGISAEIQCCVINKNNLTQIRETLLQIADDNPECVMDLTGGDELALVAVGTVANTLTDRNISFHRINISTRKVIEYFHDETKSNTFQEPTLTVDENIALYGGTVVFNRTSEHYTHLWDWDDNFIRDVDAMWNICRQDCVTWNSLVSSLGRWIVHDSLYVSVTNMQDTKNTWDRSRNFFGKLQDAKIISGYSSDNDGFSFKFKDEQVRQCFEKAGNILELKTYHTMKNLSRKGGVPYFTDILSGVYIDWDGVLHQRGDDARDTANEIDVIAMSGLIPCFVSCKNGEIPEVELYKLNTVAEKFGGNYAKKFLIATYMDKSFESLKYLRQRAKDMGITLIENVHLLSDGEFVVKLKAALF